MSSSSLNTGIILAHFSLDGKIPKQKDCLKIVASGTKMILFANLEMSRLHWPCCLAKLSAATESTPGKKGRSMQDRLRTA